MGELIQFPGNYQDDDMAPEEGEEFDIDGYLMLADVVLEKLNDPGTCIKKGCDKKAVTFNKIGNEIHSWCESHAKRGN